MGQTRKWWQDVGYILTALGMMVLAFFTQEVVTFLMLGYVLMALLNINYTLKQILRRLDEK
jgi:MFS-type transporter involved in bile tolerance (Atg22 family)